MSDNPTLLPHSPIYPLERESQLLWYSLVWGSRFSLPIIERASEAFSLSDEHK